MTTARQIIDASMSLGLNKLSPGETLSADDAVRALGALNLVVDEINGGKHLLWREGLVTGTVTGTGTLGTTWATIAPGAQILGATYDEGDGDQVIAQITMQQWHEAIVIKSTGGVPQVFAYDGASTLFFYPAPVAIPVSLRYRFAAPDFADLDTDYVLPAGWKSALTDMLTERLALLFLGGVSPKIAADSARAKNRLIGQSLRPGIIDGGSGSGNILNGWN
jgi:hypothetical protein